MKNTIVQKEATVRHANVENSMIGNSAVLNGQPADLSLGDFNVLRV